MNKVSLDQSGSEGLALEEQLDNSEAAAIEGPPYILGKKSDIDAINATTTIDNTPYIPTLAKTSNPFMKKRWLIARGLEALFKFSGRTSRIEFLVALPFLFMLASISFLFIIGVRGDLASMLLFYAITALPAFLLQKKRIHDIGLPAILSGLIALATPILPLFLVSQPILAGFPWSYALMGWIILLAALPSFRTEEEEGN